MADSARGWTTTPSVVAYGAGSSGAELIVVWVEELASVVRSTGGLRSPNSATAATTPRIASTASAGRELPPRSPTPDLRIPLPVPHSRP